MFKEWDLLYLNDLVRAFAANDEDTVHEQRTIEAIELFILFEFPLFVIFSVLWLLLEMRQRVDRENLLLILAIKIQLVAILPMLSLESIPFCP